MSVKMVHTFCSNLLDQGNDKFDQLLAFHSFSKAMTFLGSC